MKHSIGVTATATIKWPKGFGKSGRRLSSIPKTKREHIEKSIVGIIRSGASIRETVKTLGVARPDVEAVVIDRKLSVKPDNTKFQTLHCFC